MPTGVGRRIGQEVKAAVEAAHDFDANYFHLKRGGHVAALHHHRDSEWFARIDISRFFYSVSRRKVQSALARIGVPKPRFLAQWSTVRNPYGEPLFALPYGFVQSPILASLVVATSAIGDHLRGLEPGVRVSIYMDDIALSGSSKDAVVEAYEGTLSLLAAEGFEANGDKLRPPSQQIDIFNCDLSAGKTAVRDDRIAAFFLTEPSEASEAAFAAYCESVESGNTHEQNRVTQSVTQRPHIALGRWVGSG